MGIFGGRKRVAGGINIGKKSSAAKIKNIIEGNNFIRIDIVTTDQGPMEDDVFWVITDKDNETYHIPQTAPGFESLIQICEKVDGFKMNELISSMSCADNRVFNLWIK